MVLSGEKNRGIMKKVLVGFDGSESSSPNRLVDHHAPTEDPFSRGSRNTNYVGGDPTPTVPGDPDSATVGIICG